MVPFYPPLVPTVESQAVFTANVLMMPFGDGYEQGCGVGLSPVRGAYTLSWDLLTTEQRDDIEDFFSEQGGEPFLYTFPGESTPRVFKCKTWHRGHDGVTYTLRADLVEVFN